MKPRSAHNVVVLVLCVLALVVAQTFGGKGGYVCLCSGTPVPTLTSHCYGPHGANCHADEVGEVAAVEACHPEEGAGDREDHSVVSEEVRMRPVEVAPQLVAPQVLLAVLPRIESLFSSRAACAPARCSVDFGESPPFGVTVARTIVLRI